MITHEEAIARVRPRCDVHESVPGEVWFVRRLDRPSGSYLLVQLGSPEASLAVATVDPDSGAIGVHARLPGTARHMTVNAPRAVELAALGADATVEAVWMPCSLSKSPLYPFWRVAREGQVRFVDQQGGVADSLDTASPGG